MDAFGEQRFADATIEKVCVFDGCVRVSVRNWRGEEETIIFKDAIGLAGHGIANAELSHGTETTNDPLMVQCCVACEEDLENFRCFSFFSAWTDAPILKIIARSFESVRL